MKRLLYTAPAIIIFFALSPRLVGIGGAVVMIGGLIFLHELGHFLAAKRMGMPVEVFSLGFGKRLVGFRWRETDVRLSMLPLGGYVKLAGYNPEDPEAEDPHGFLKQPFGKRMLFYSGGILANVATTMVLLCILAVDQSRSVMRPVSSPLLITEVVQGRAAALGGLRAGDQITALGSLTFPGSGSEEARAFIEKHPGQPLPIRVDRNGKALDLVVTPENDRGSGRIGIHFEVSKVAYDRQPLTLRDLGRGTLAGVVETGHLAGMIGKSFWRLVSTKGSYKELGGPIAIAKMGSEAAKAGWERFFMLCALISMNLAVLNALPIPFLDGGHMAILVIERLRKREFSIAMKERILTVGFYFLVSLMGLVLAMDLWRLKQ